MAFFQIYAVLEVLLPSALSYLIKTSDSSKQIGNDHNQAYQYLECSDHPAVDYSGLSVFSAWLDFTSGAMYSVLTHIGKGARYGGRPLVLKGTSRLQMFSTQDLNICQDLGISTIVPINIEF